VIGSIIKPAPEPGTVSPDGAAHDAAGWAQALATLLRLHEKPADAAQIAHQ